MLCHEPNGNWRCTRCDAEFYDRSDAIEHDEECSAEQEDNILERLEQLENQVKSLTEQIGTIELVIRAFNNHPEREDLKPGEILMSSLARMAAAWIELGGLKIDKNKPSDFDDVLGEIDEENMKRLKKESEDKT